MPSLPDADAVYRRFFVRWHEAEALERRAYRNTRPDVESWGTPGLSVLEASPLTRDGERAAAAQIDTMLDAAREDWHTMLGVSGPPSLDWIDRFDRHFDAVAVARVLAASDPTDFGNELVVLSCEFGAVLGEVLRLQAPSLTWLYDWPYWESGLYDASAGMRINVFHWAIKKFSGYGVDDGFQAKVLACCEQVGQGWQS